MTPDLGVQMAGCTRLELATSEDVYKRQDRRIREHRARNSEQLALTLREVRSVFLDDRVIAIGQKLDEMIGLRELGGQADVLLLRVFRPDVYKRQVERGRCDYGVVATENSLEGPVTACLDNFATHNNVTILAETVLDIHHSLVLHPDASIDEVTTIVSHPQGLGQCRRYIACLLYTSRCV